VVVASHVNRAARDGGRPHRYDLVLDVVAPDLTMVRTVLDDVELGPMAPVIGSTVHVELLDGRVEVLWRGDPNLDLHAHRRQLADLAERARMRRASDWR
jgi:hypothetical protein